MIIVDVWKTTPFMALLILAGLQMLPGECYEAARVDGVHPLRGVLPGDAAADPAGAAGGGDLPRARRAADLRPDLRLTGNNKSTMSMSVYARQQLVDFQEVGYGSAAATMLFLIIAVFTVGLPHARPASAGRTDGHAAPCAAQAALGPARLFYLLVAIIVVYTVFPFYWAIVSSLRTGVGPVLDRPGPAPARPGQLRRGVPRAALRPQHR